MLSGCEIERARTADLVRLVEEDLGPGKRSGRWVLYVCPFHPDHDPSLAVTNGDGDRGPTWRCFGCGRYGDGIDWLREYRQIQFSEAVGVLSGGKVETERKPNGGRVDYRQAGKPPGPRWQMRALQLIERAEASLWSRAGNEIELEWPMIDPETGELRTVKASALDWLFSRGLTEATIRLWKLGFIPRDWSDDPELWGLSGDPVFIPRGILIPCIVGNWVWYLKIRRPLIKPKYGQVKGGRQAIYMVQTLEWQDEAVLCEGELDALLLWQEIGDLAGVATLGSASSEIDLATWGLHLVRIRRWNLVYDLDKSGQEGAERLSWLRSSRRLRVPQLKPHDKDLTDYFRSGGDLRGWLNQELQEPGD